MTDARALVRNEPTSSLGLADIEQLFGLIERLRAGAVVCISHFLEEVQRVTQRYTVLHDGRNVGSGLIADGTLTRLGRADDRPAAKARWSERWRVRRTER